MKSETVTLFYYYISQISVVAKDGGGNFHSVIISQMHVFICSKIKNCGQYLMNAEHAKNILYSQICSGQLIFKKF